MNSLKLFKRNEGRQYLYLLGAEHSHDPGHLQFEEIEKYWDDFLENTEKGSRVAVTESGVIEVDEDKSKQEIIKESSESGFLAWLAQRSDVEVLCLEPSIKEQFSFLEDQFGREEIAHYFFARIVHQWHRLSEPKPPLKEYLQPYFERDKQASGWDDFDFTFEHLKEIHEDLLGVRFDPEDEELFHHLSAPLDEYPTNQVVQVLGPFRDKVVTQRVEELWNEGKSIFMVYGKGHLPRQKEYLEKQLN